MIDYFLLYSLNIIIIIMVYHTYMTAHIGEAFAPNQDDMEIHRVCRIKLIIKWTLYIYRLKVSRKNGCLEIQMRKINCGINSLPQVK